MENIRNSVGAVHSLDRYEIEVPDLDDATAFFRAFGLVVDRDSERLSLKCEGSDHIWAILSLGDRKRLSKVRFTAYEEDIPAIAKQIERFGAPLSVQPDGSLLTCNPDGVSFEIAAGKKTSPEAKAPFDFAPIYSEQQAAAPRSLCATVAPRRLAHIALFTSDVDKAIEFCTQALGIRLSDRSQSNVAFLHGAHGSDHHMIAFSRSDGPGFHHSSWEVHTLDEVGLGAQQMEAAGYAEGWGLGRHVLGSNYFRYVRDPWGSYAEYSANMDYIAHDAAWVAADHPGEDSFYQWGPQPPQDFVTNYELMEN